jgi:hypothetical protein
VWSLAVPTSELHPRGFRRAAGVTLPGEALTYGPLRGVLEDPDIVKPAHNAPHDWHAARNAGVHVRGLVDTLPWARVALPEWAGFPGHGLKELARRLLGRDMTEYKDVLSEPNVVPVTRTHRVTRCLVEGVPCWYPAPCRRRGAHKREVSTVETTEYVTRGTRLMPLESVVPGHPRHATLVGYAAQDAEAALELWQLLGRQTVAPVEVPWAP